MACQLLSTLHTTEPPTEFRGTTVFRPTATTGRVYYYYLGTTQSTGSRKFCGVEELGFLRQTNHMQPSALPLTLCEPPPPGPQFPYPCSRLALKHQHGLGPGGLSQRCGGCRCAGLRSGKRHPERGAPPAIAARPSYSCRLLGGDSRTRFSGPHLQTRALSRPRPVK